MANVLDLAAHIPERKGPMTTWKIQNLVYYGQAWSLVWDDDALFPEEVEAWANGPVVRAIYNAHRGKYRGSRLPRGEADALNDDQRETVDAVLGFYGDRSPQWLNDLTHMETPWQSARLRIGLQE